MGGYWLAWPGLMPSQALQGMLVMCLYHSSQSSLTWVLQSSYQSISVLLISSDPEYSCKTIGFLTPIFQMWKLRSSSVK